MWILITYIVILVTIAFIVFRKRPGLPIFINGMIPGKIGAESKAESGSTILISFSDIEEKQPGWEIFRGYADENGAVKATVDASSIGRTVRVRIRHAGFRFQDTELKIEKYGLFFTARLEEDGVYDRPVRGALPNDMNEHFEDSTLLLNKFQTDAIRLAYSFQSKIGYVPVPYWAIFYLLLILGFAATFYSHACSFNSGFDSFWHALYFSVVTISTLGYGETYPTTDFFRMLCSLEAISGVLIIGLFLNSMFSERRY